MDFLNQLNQSLFLQIFHLARQNPVLDFLMVFGADYLVFVVFAIGIFIFLIGKPEMRTIRELTISLVISIVAIRILNTLFYEPRPFLSLQINPLVYQPEDGSFPSLHTAVLTILAFSLINTKHKYGHIMLVPVIWTGFARVYTGVHFPLDILGGFIVGALSVITAAKFFQKA